MPGSDIFKFFVQTNARCEKQLRGKGDSEENSVVKWNGIRVFIAFIIHRKSVTRIGSSDPCLQSESSLGTD